MSIGVAVSHRLGRQLAMTLVASLVLILFSHFFFLFSFFLHCLLFKKKEFQYYTYYTYNEGPWFLEIQILQHYTYYMYYHGSLFFLEVIFDNITHITHITRGPCFL